MILEGHIDLLSMRKEALEWHCDSFAEKLCTEFGNLEWHVGEGQN